MLVIKVVGEEVFDDSAQEFFTTGDFELQLEHSLASLSKWESKFEKPFLGGSSKTGEELVAYIEAMVLTENPPGNFLEKLSDKNIAEINAYVDKNMTATWFNEDPTKKNSGTVVTAELIYYWMISFQIPFECQYWHLNRLLTLIRVCEIKSAKPKKMGRSELAAHNRRLNAERKAKWQTKG